MRIVLVVLVFGIALIGRFFWFIEEKPTYNDGQEVRLEVLLQEEPELSNRGQRFRIHDAYNQGISVTAEAFPRFHYGDRLVIQGTIDVKVFEDGRTFVSLYYPQTELQSSASNSIVSAAYAIREQSKHTFEQTLPTNSASLLMGIVFGAKEQFPDYFFDALQATGVLHVIAASGMNVTFIAAALLYTLGAIMQRQIALVIGACGIIFYVFLVGFEPSIIRASLMALLAFGASLLGRQHFAALAVVFSAYVMLLWQPGFLFDVGFQLSFLATLGILYIKPLLDRKLHRFQKIGGETLTTTLAAQIATTPLLIGVFGKIGLLALLVNVLILWTVPIVMLLGSLAAVTNLLIPPLAQPFLFCCLPFLWLFETVVTFFGHAAGIVELGSIPWLYVVAFYAFLVASVLLTKPKSKPLGLEESLALEKY